MVQEKDLELEAIFAVEGNKGDDLRPFSVKLQHYCECYILDLSNFETCFEREQRQFSLRM